MDMDQASGTATLDEQLDALAPAPLGEAVDIVDPPSMSEVIADEQPASKEPAPIESIQSVAETAPVAEPAINDEAPITDSPPVAEIPTTPITAEPSPDQPPYQAGMIVRLGRALISPLVQVLMVLDKPFSRLGSGLKTIIGIVAVATGLIAATTWAAICFLPAQ
jgi:hypothetical protein